MCLDASLAVCQAASNGRRIRLFGAVAASCNFSIVWASLVGRGSRARNELRKPNLLDAVQQRWACGVSAAMAAGAGRRDGR
jgi:hypothetical protein